MGLPTQEAIVRFAPVILAACLALPPGAAAAQDAPPAPRPDSLALARRYSAWFNGGQYDSLFAHTADGARQNLSAEWWRQRGDEMALRLGTEVEVIEERFRMRNGRPQYWRTARYSDFAEPFLLRFVLDAEGKIDGVGTGPLSSAPPTDD